MKRQMCAKKLHEITRHIFNDRLIKLLLFVTEWFMTLNRNKGWRGMFNDIFYVVKS